MVDMKTYMKKRRSKNKQYAVDKLGGKCIKCESTNNLQFDHIKTRKENGGFVIANMLSHGRAKLDKELAMCQLLCEDCHKTKTLKDMGWKDAKVEHGTPRSHLYCKCAVCKSAHNKRINEYRWKNGIRKKRNPL